MAEKSLFFDSFAGDRQYFAADIAMLLRGLHVRDGVVIGVDDQFEHSFGLGMELLVGKGAAWIQGRLYRIDDSAVALPIPVADQNLSRIDRVVLKLDLNIEARSIRVGIKTGTPSSSPVPPSLERNQYVWEISLYQYTIPAAANNPSQLVFIDERTDYNLCGYINSIYYISTATEEMHGLMSKEDKAIFDTRNTQLGDNPQGPFNTVDDRFVSGESRISTNENSISVIQGKQSTDETNIGQLQTDLSDTNGNVSQLQTDLNTTNDNVTRLYDVATQSKDGLMSSSDKKKLDGISPTINDDSFLNSIIFGG